MLVTRVLAALQVSSLRGSPLRTATLTAAAAATRTLRSTSSAASPAVLSAAPALPPPPAPPQVSTLAPPPPPHQPPWWMLVLFNGATVLIAASLVQFFMRRETAKPKQQGTGLTYTAAVEIVQGVFSKGGSELREKPHSDYIDLVNQLAALFGQPHIGKYHLITGEPGAGKTTVVHEAVRKVAEPRNVLYFSVTEAQTFPRDLAFAGQAAGPAGSL